MNATAATATTSIAVLVVVVVLLQLPPVVGTFHFPQQTQPYSNFTVYHCTYGLPDFMYRLFPGVRVVRWEKKEKKLNGAVDVFVYGFNDCPDDRTMSTLRRVLVVNNFGGEKSWRHIARENSFQNSRVGHCMEKGYVYIGGLGSQAYRIYHHDQTAFVRKYPSILRVPYASKEVGAEFAAVDRSSMYPPVAHYVFTCRSLCILLLPNMYSPVTHYVL